MLWRPEPTSPPPVNVVIDADSFARAFASALAPILEAIERSRQATTHFPPPTQSFRVVQTPPPKKSFWANAWHADVLLSAVAVVIVLAVLVAWTS